MTYTKNRTGVPGSLQADILMRAFDDKAFAELLTAYNEAKLYRTRTRELTKEDMHAWKLWKEGLAVTEIAQRMHKKPHQIDSCINAYARTKAV